MGDVVRLDVATTLDLPVERILNGAKDLQLVFILGYDQEGNEYFASSTGDNLKLLWLLERAKITLMGEQE